MNVFQPDHFFNKDTAIFKELFLDTEFVWEGLKNINAYLYSHINPNISKVPIESSVVVKTTKLDNGAVIYGGSYFIGEDIEVGSNSIIEPGALIKGPTIIGKNTEIRQGAYVRGNVIIGNNCVAGHATEIKNSCLLANSKAGHFAYIGDSILGAVNLGAGTKLANLKLTGTEIMIKMNGEKYNTKLRKFGAILADGVEMGCNSVTSPGTLLSKNVMVYPGVSVYGYHPADTIIK